MRVDKKKNVLKVLKSVIAKPLQTQEEICKDTKLWKWTVWRALEEVGKIGNEIKMIDFIQSDLEVQKKIQDEIQRRLNTQAWDITNQDLTRFADFAFRRSQILWWGATERKEINVVSDTQARLLASIIISDENLLTN